MDINQFRELLDTTKKSVNVVENKPTGVNIKNARAEVLELAKACKDFRVALQAMKNK